MKMKREGYTFGAGALVGLMASNRPLYIFAAGLVAGLALGGGIYFYAQLLDIFRSLKRRVRAKREPGLGRTTPTPVYDGAPSKVADDDIPY